MENWLFDILQLPAESVAEEVIPKQFLSQNFSLSSGEKNLLSYSVDEMAIIGALGAEYDGTPAGEKISGAAALVVETKGGKFDKDAPKIAEMLQKYLPQQLIIGLTDGEKACVAMAKKSVTEEGVVTLHEMMMSSAFTIEESESIAAKLAYSQHPKEDMDVLWSSYCEVLGDL